MPRSRSSLFTDARAETMDEDLIVVIDGGNFVISSCVAGSECKDKGQDCIGDLRAASISKILWRLAGFFCKEEIWTGCGEMFLLSGSKPPFSTGTGGEMTDGAFRGATDSVIIAAASCLICAASGTYEDKEQEYRGDLSAASIWRYLSKLASFFFWGRGFVCI